MDKKYLIKKWLCDELSDEELKAFELLDDYNLHTKIIENAENFKASNFSKVDIFDSLEKRLLEKVPVKKLNWVQPLLRIAAVFVVAMSAYFLFFFNNLTKVQTLASQKTTTELPDASIVTLNALSELSYNKNKWDNNREVHLDGEAFFTVAKGKVFDVITSEGKVTVIGTQFNVKQRSDYFEVKCYEGIVRVTSNKTTKALLPGDTFRIYKGTISFNTTPFQVPQWTQNISNFKAVPFREVIEEIERQYNITVNHDSGINTTRLFTGGFVHDSLENALKSITVPQGLTYKIELSNQVRLENSGR